MNKIYLAIGVLQLSVSSAVLIYLLILIIQKYQCYNNVYSLSHGLSTILLGIFYVVSSVILPGTKFMDVLNNDTFIYPNNSNLIMKSEYTNTFSNMEENASRPLMFVEKQDSEMEYFRNFLNYKLQNAPQNYPRTQKLLQHTENIPCREVLYLYLLLLYSFVHGMVYLLTNNMRRSVLQQQRSNIADGSNGKPGNSLKLGIQKNEILEETESTKQFHMVSNNDHILSVLLVLCEWLLPIISSSCVLMMVTDQRISNVAVPYENINLTKFSKDELGHMANYTNSSFHMEIENVLNKVYTIMKQINSTEYQEPFIVNTAQISDDNRYTCSDEGNGLRTYLFILIICYTLIITCSGNVTKLTASSCNLLIFATCWLPASLEIIIRKYIYNSSPSLVSELMLLTGTFNQIFVNILNAYSAKRIKNVVTPHN